MFEGRSSKFKALSSVEGGSSRQAFTKLASVIVPGKCRIKYYIVVIATYGYTNHIKQMLHRGYFFFSKLKLLLSAFDFLFNENLKNILLYIQKLIQNQKYSIDLKNSASYSFNNHCIDTKRAYT